MAGLEPAATERRIDELKDSLATVQAQVANSFGCQFRHYKDKGLQDLQ